MAINKAVFRVRALTAVAFAAVMLAGLFLGMYSFIILCMIIIAGCLYEYMKIARKFPKRQTYLFALLAPLYIVLPVLLLMMLGILPDPDKNSGNEVIYSPLLPCTVIGSIWINDTMAYIVGSLIGKTPFSKISPKKTWEGTIGGIVLCIVVMGLIGSLLPAAKVLALHHWIAIAAIAAIFGTAGDLLESKIKRMAGIKDSGSFMPGHGGFLDRFDSLLIAAPFVWLYACLFIR
jgi:phosphatidate cytidylyltransferase